MALLAIAAVGVGFGGMSAWQVTTQNNGNTVSTGSVHHSNTTTLDAGGNSATTTCLDSGSASPGTCGMIFKISALKPGGSSSNTLTLTNTGTLASSFVLTEPSTPVTSSPESGHTTLCASLTLVITDNESMPATLYSNPIVMGQGGSPTSVTLKASNGNTSWAQSNSGIFTFAITLPTSSVYTDSDSTCTAAMLITQTNS